MATPPTQTHSRISNAPVPLLTDRAYERLKHDVITCVLAPGTEISEPQLCLHYRLGKAPVRMALIRLAHEGLVRAIPRRGYLISPVTLKDIQDIFELRLMLEPRAARMAAGNIDARRARALETAASAGYLVHDARSITSFLDANKARPGVVVTPSGLQYEVLKAGKGAKPTRDQTVEVHYHGTLPDGTVFDSSVQRGETITFPVTGVIPGWVEALQLMQVGAKWRLVIPSDLAYGPEGSDPIPPGATLIFEVELIGIE